MFKYIFCLFALILIGCGSDTYSTANTDPCLIGTLGCSCFENQTCNDKLACNSDSVCADETTGCTTDCAGSGGSETGGTSGGTGANASTGGTGGDNTGGNTGGTGGASGGTGGTCTMETCEDVAKRLSNNVVSDACGIVTDKCGNVLNCDSCNTGFNCGASIWSEATSGAVPNEFFKITTKFTAGNANVCGNECVVLKGSADYYAMTLSNTLHTCESDFGSDYLLPVLCEDPNSDWFSGCKDWITDTGLTVKCCPETNDTVKLKVSFGHGSGQ